MVPNTHQIFPYDNIHTVFSVNIINHVDTQWWEQPRDYNQHKLTIALLYNRIKIVITQS